MTKAIVSTSANPFHFGHLDIYNKAKEIFDNVKVVIGQNPDKSLSQNTKFHLNAYNIPFEIVNNKTIADYCLENNITHIVRGIRNGVDAEYELKLDFINRELNVNVQTIFIPTSDTFANVSSSTIRELIKYNKFDIIKKYMNEDAMWRYIFGERYICYFGKSCVGKTTYLNYNNIKSINVDTYLWEISNKIHGEYQTNKFKEDSKHLIYSDKFTPEEKFVILYNQDYTFFTNQFWDEFFRCIPIGYAIDWASIGIYWDLIPSKYRGQIKFVELTCDSFLREERIKSKNFTDKIKYIDSLYKMPKIVDERINL